MVDDHSKANDELKSIAASKGITLPTSLSAKEQATYDRLTKLSGAEFDRAYMKDMVEDHVKDVAMFEKEAKNGKDADVKAFADKTLPTLREHLQMARDVNAKVNANAAGSKSTSSNTKNPK
jgi:putative membrane protein